MSKTGLEERDAAAAAVAVAPRVTLAQIESLILDEEYFISKRKVTICVLTLKNGFKTTGVSAAVSLENFNEALGKKIAREKAVAEIWPLAAYLLQETLHREGRATVMRCKVNLNMKSPSIFFDHHSKRGAQVPSPYREGEEMADINDPANWKADGTNVTFHAVYGGTADDGKNACMENRIFADATPSFTINGTIRNQHVLAALEQGRAYYVDFIPAD